MLKVERFLRLPQKWESEAPAEPWDPRKNGFDRSLPPPGRTRNVLASVFSSEAVSFLDGGFLGIKDKTNRMKQILFIAETLMINNS